MSPNAKTIIVTGAVCPSHLSRYRANATSRIEASEKRYANFSYPNLHSETNPSDS